MAPELRADAATPEEAGADVAAVGEEGAALVVDADGLAVEHGGAAEAADGMAEAAGGEGAGDAKLGGGGKDCGEREGEHGEQREEFPHTSLRGAKRYEAERRWRDSWSFGVAMMGLFLPSGSSERAAVEPGAVRRQFPLKDGLRRQTLSEGIPQGLQRPRFSGGAWNAKETMG